MEKSECIDIFNSMIRGNPIPFKDKLLPIYSEYLTENNIENSEKIINLVVQNPKLIQRFIPEIIEYYCRKYTILSINLSKFNNLNPILYYE